MSATPFADHRTTAGDTFSGQSRIIYILCLLTPSYTLRIPVYTNGTLATPVSTEGGPFNFQC